MSMNIYGKSGTYNYKGESLPFSFKTSLRASEKVYFVNSVSELLIGENYNSVLDELLFDFFIIDVFTNVDTSWMYESIDENAEDIDYIGMMEDFILETNIVEIVKANAEDGLIDDLREALNRNIEYKTGIHRNVISDSIADLIKTIEKKVDGFNVDAESMMGMMDLLSGLSGELTMENMLDAYAKSDMYKENRKLIEEKNRNHEAMIDEVTKSSIEDTAISSPDYEA